MGSSNICDCDPFSFSLDQNSSNNPFLWYQINNYSYIDGTNLTFLIAWNLTYFQVEVLLIYVQK